MAAPGASAIAGLDHALVGVRDLEAARASWGRLGLKVTPRGRHIGWGTANYCIMFEQGYVELLGIVDPDQFTNGLDRFLAEREGLLGVAFRSTDNDRTASWLRAAGYSPDGPKDLKRTIELPGGDVTPAFKLLYLPPEDTPGLRSFLCQHLTPEIVWQPGWSTHAIRAVSLKSVVTVVERPSELAPAYARLFGAAAIQDAADWLRVDAGEGELLFVTDAELRRLYPGLEITGHRPPWTAALRVGVLILADAADYLDSKGVRIVNTGRGVALPPELATGVILELVNAVD